MCAEFKSVTFCLNIKTHNLVPKTDSSVVSIQHTNCCIKAKLKKLSKSLFSKSCKSKKKIRNYVKNLKKKLQEVYWWVFLRDDAQNTIVICMINCHDWTNSELTITLLNNQPEIIFSNYGKKKSVYAKVWRRCVENESSQYRGHSIFKILFCELQV